jgi:hypothetical protein
VANRAREALGSFISPQENLAVGVSKIWIYPGPRPDMSGHHLWNPDAKPDIAERPDMSGLGPGHVRPESLESSC